MDNAKLRNRSFARFSLMTLAIQRGVCAHKWAPEAFRSAPKCGNPQPSQPLPGGANRRHRRASIRSPHRRGEHIVRAVPSSFREQRSIRPAVSLGSAGMEHYRKSRTHNSRPAWVLAAKHSHDIHRRSGRHRWHLLGGLIAAFGACDDRIRNHRAEAPSSFMSSSATKRDSSSCNPASGTCCSVLRSKPAP